MSMVILALLVILLFSSASGWWLVNRKPQEKPVKIMMFIGYFWLMTFLQLFLFALFNYLDQRFFSH